MYMFVVTWIVVKNNFKIWTHRLHVYVIVQKGNKIAQVV